MRAEGEAGGPLRMLRGDLHTGLAQLQMAAEASRGAEPRLALAALDQSVTFARSVLLPQLRAEEFTLYPAFDRIVGHPGALDVLVAQHRSIARMADDLGQVAGAARKRGDPSPYLRYLDPLLHGLYATVRVHVESEDDAILPILEQRLDAFEIVDLVEQAERIMRRLARDDLPRP